MLSSISHVSAWPVLPLHRLPYSMAYMASIHCLPVYAFVQHVCCHHLTCNLATTIIIMSAVAGMLPIRTYARHGRLAYWLFLLAGARSSVHCATCKDIVQQNRPSQCFINFTCKPIRPKPRFVDPVAGKWLWRWSAETTSLPAELDLPEQLTAKTA